MNELKKKPNFAYLAFVAVVLAAAALWFRSIAAETNRARDEYHEKTGAFSDSR